MRLAAASALARTRAARLVTRLPPQRLARVARSRAARRAFAPAGAWFGRGEIKVAGGLGVGLRLSAAELPLWHAHAHALIRGTLETPLQEAFRRLLGPGAVLYDVGANLGFFTLIGARRVGEAGHVYAFEPAPANARAVRRNVELNGLGNVTVVEKAAAAGLGRARLLLPHDLIWARLESVGWHPDTQGTIEVDVVAVDDLVDSGELRAPDVVKIDVEGAELDALAGMRRTLAEHRPAVLCEMHGRNSEYVALLDELGYAAQSLEGPEPLADAPPDVRTIALPRG